MERGIGMARKRMRGVSFGTILVLILTLSVSLVAAVIFARISGDMGQISIDPKLLTEPLAVLARNVTNTEPEATTPPSPTATSAPNPTNALNMARYSATTAPTEPPIRSFSLTAVGQITIGGELREAAQQGDAYQFDSMLEPVIAALSSGDLSIATLRTGLSESTYSDYAAPAALAYSLKNAGVNLFNLATDRLLDKSVNGLSETRSIVEKARASTAGAYRNQEERQRLNVIEINGIKVGLLSYTGTISNTGKKAASQEEIAIATRMLNAEAAAVDIAALRAQGAEIIIVLAHWGNRSDTKASKETRAIVDALATAGADVIIGTNPTSIHGLERRMVTDASGKQREVFIAYSLGNFLIDDSRDTNNITGLILHLGIQWDTQAKRAIFQDAWYMPTWIMRWRDTDGGNSFRVVPAGMATIPEGMTDNVYVKMKKAHQGVLTQLGTDAAVPRAE